MAPLNSKDQFANRFSVHVTEAGVGIPSYEEVPTYASAFSKEAFIMHKIEYFFPSTCLNALVADSDILYAALTTQNFQTTLAPLTSVREPGVVDMIEIRAHTVGAAANFVMMEQPFIHDFTSLPGGGLIVPARPIYIGVSGAGIAVAASVDVRGWFTKIELKDAEFLELIDAYRMIR